MLPALSANAPDMVYAFAHHYFNQISAVQTLVSGAPGFFTPKLISPWLGNSTQPENLSFYDTKPLRETLERLVDFDRINSGEMRFSVGAVNVASGNFEYFDNTTHKIDARHVMASGALPPGLPAVEIDGEYYWDGGVVSNTPLQWVLENKPRQDSLVFQVDLWRAVGHVPTDFINQDMRLKDIRYSSRTRLGTDQFRKNQSLRRALHNLQNSLPKTFKSQADPQIKALFEEADDKIYNIVHLIYRTKRYEGDNKDFEFSRSTMKEHWASGYADALETLKHPEILQRPSSPDGVGIFDLDQRTRRATKY